MPEKKQQTKKPAPAPAPKKRKEARKQAPKPKPPMGAMYVQASTVFMNNNKPVYLSRVEAAQNAKGVVKGKYEEKEKGHKKTVVNLNKGNLQKYLGRFI